MRVRLVAAAAAVLLVAGCGSGGASGTDGDGVYRVLVSAGLSAQGVLAANAETAVLAARASVADINKAGGIGGSEVEIEVVDDAGDPSVAITKLREATTGQDKPDLYLSSGPSNVSSAVLPILNREQILSFNIGPTESSADPGQFPLNFDLSPSPKDYVEGFLPHIEQQSYGSVGVIHGNTSYGETFGPMARQVLSAAGVKVTGIEEYDVEGLDMTAQLSRLRDKNPDALVMDGYGPPVGYLLRSLDRLGWDVPVLGNTSVSATKLVSTEPPSGMLGTELVTNLKMQVFSSTVYSEQADKVNKLVETMTGLGEIPTTLILAYHYDALPLVAAAAEHVGATDDATALAEALENQEVLDKAKTVVLDSYHFTAQEHAPNVGDDVFAFVAPSKIVNGQFRGATE